MDAQSIATHRIAELEVALAAERERVIALERERDVLRASHERLRLELELLKRRLFFAKAERVDTAQLELEFAAKLRALEEVAGTLNMPPRDEADGSKPKGTRSKPKGRRDLRELPLEEKRIELTDPLFEKLVAEGKAERAGFDESCKLGWQRAGMRRIVIARAKYSTVGADGESSTEATPVPREVVSRCLATASLLAHIIVAKFCEGLPLFRLERRFGWDGATVDRGTMSRWLEEVGGALGATIVAAMRQEALATAFCIATDATGAAIQPEPRKDGQRQPCRRGHFFVMLADADHVLFEYTPHETSAVVSELFKGFGGYVQADAKSVYDVLFRASEDEPTDGPDGDDDAGAGKRKEVACWVHGRRGFWEATIAKCPIAREGLARIGRMFELDATWSDKPPDDVKRLREAHLRPHMEAFFAWVDAEYEKVHNQRGSLRKALGYARRHKDALCRVLDDGRLIMDNNRSERALRVIAVGRKAWLFFGSDDHAESAASLFSLLASARLHRLDPEAYIRDVLRVLPYWPKDRYLELAPKYWSATRARLSADELRDEVDPITVPPDAAASSEQKALAG